MQICALSVTSLVEAKTRSIFNYSAMYVYYAYSYVHFAHISYEKNIILHTSRKVGPCRQLSG